MTVSDAAVDAADDAIPYLPMEREPRRASVRRMLEAALPHLGAAPQQLTLIDGEGKLQFYERMP